MEYSNNQCRVQGMHVSRVWFRAYGEYVQDSHSHAFTPQCIHTLYVGSSIVLLVGYLRDTV